MKYLLILFTASALLLAGCNHRAPAKETPRNIDTLYFSHYLIYEGPSFSERHAGVKYKYVHDKTKCGRIPGTGCYKRNHGAI